MILIWLNVVDCSGRQPEYCELQRMQNQSLDPIHFATEPERVIPLTAADVVKSDLIPGPIKPKKRQKGFEENPKNDSL